MFTNRVSSGHYIFYFIFIIYSVDKTPFNLAHITEDVTKFICRNVIGLTPDRLNWIDFCIYSQINKLESLIDKNLRYIILPAISFFPIEQVEGIKNDRKLSL